MLTVLEDGGYTGGLLVFPRWHVAVDVRDRDVLLFDPHEPYGNTAIAPQGSGGRGRLSMILDFRAGMVHCLPPEREILRAQRRRRGKPLNP